MCKVLNELTLSALKRYAKVTQEANGGIIVEASKRKEIDLYTSYDPYLDITIVWRETIKYRKPDRQTCKEQVITTEIVDWYYGTPDNTSTEKYGIKPKRSNLKLTNKCYNEEVSNDEV